MRRLWIPPLAAATLFLFLFNTVTNAAADRQNLSLLIFLPYAVEGNDDRSYQYDNINASIYSLDIAAEAAVVDVVRSKSILHNVNVDLIRVNGWNEEYAGQQNYSLIDSGGAAAVAMYEALSTHPVVGIVGDYFSKTTLFSAAVASQLQVPMCGATQGSPKLSDRREYATFFRTLNANFGPHLLKLLHYLEVTRIAVIHGADSASAQYTKNVVDAMTDVIVGEKIKVDTMTDPDGLSNLLGRLRRSGITCFVSVLYPGDIEDFYFAAARAGLVGPQYLWIGLNPPIVLDSDPEADWKRQQAVGFINSITLSYLQSFATKKFIKLFTLLTTRNHPSSFDLPEDFLPLPQSDAFYDCVKTILIGIDQLLKRSPGLTVAELGTPEGRSALGLDPFKSTGYFGAMGAAMELEPSGDMKVIKGEPRFTSDTGSMYDSDIFAISLIDGGDLIVMNDPVFYGGSTTPPLFDNNLRERQLPAHSNAAFAVTAASLFACLLISLTLFHSLSMFIHVFSRDSAPTAADVQFAIQSFAAGCLFTASLLFGPGGLASLKGESETGKRDAECIKGGWVEYAGYGVLFR
ncbi:hypothetical protein HDU96_002725 [Phlyctochytrium bullatum]|nr:hypothetical protein HDU96_002725 [Phlyctochytrium bullatum]